MYNWFNKNIFVYYQKIQWTQIKCISDKQFMSTIKLHVWALCLLRVIFPTFFYDDFN